MSKALAWCCALSRVQDERPPRMSVVPSEGQSLGAGVTDDGRALITHGAVTIWLTPEAVLALARWAFDTFGEPVA